MKKIKSLLSGPDGKESLRKILALVYSIYYALFGVYLGRKYQSVAELVIITTASLIGVMMGLTTWQNISFGRKDEETKPE